MIYTGGGAEKGRQHILVDVNSGLSMVYPPFLEEKQPNNSESLQVGAATNCTWGYKRV